MTEYLTIALSKGRLAEQAIELLEASGYDCSAAKEKSRKLILVDEKAGLATWKLFWEEITTRHIA